MSDFQVNSVHNGGHVKVTITGPAGWKKASAEHSKEGGAGTSQQAPYYYKLYIEPGSDSPSLVYHLNNLKDNPVDEHFKFIVEDHEGNERGRGGLIVGHEGAGGGGKE